MLKPFAVIASRLRTFFLNQLRTDGRWIICLFLCLYAGAIWAAHYGMDYARFWNFLGVPSMRPNFLDLRSILSAFECQRLGHDVAISNPCDPLGRAFNYPIIWIKFSFLGFHQAHAFILGTLIGIVFCLSWMGILGKLSLAQGAYCGLLLCSYPPMLLLERGNTDSLIFVMIVAAITLASRRDKALLWLMSCFLMVFAAALKIYPVFGLIPFLRPLNHRPRIFAAFILASVIAYGLYFFEDLRRVYEVTPKPLVYAYGWKVLAHKFDSVEMGKIFSAMPAPLSLIEILRFGASMVLCVAAGLLFINIIIFVSRSVRAIVSGIAVMKTQKEGGLALAAFETGASIYIGTYMLGNNFDYRLAFLLLTVPQLFVWSADQNALGRFSIGMLLLIYMIFQLANISYFGALNLDEILNAVLFVLLGLCLFGLWTTNKQPI